MLNRIISRNYFVILFLIKIIILTKISLVFSDASETIKYQKPCSSKTKENYLYQIREFIYDYFQRNPVDSQYNILYAEYKRKGIDIIHPGIQALCIKAEEKRKEALIAAFDEFCSMTFKDIKCLLSFNVMMTANPIIFENNINLLHEDLIEAYNKILCTQDFFS